MTGSDWKYGDSQFGFGSLADSSYVHVTVPPATTVTLLGMNMNSFMLTGAL
jgi:hypothetical protein